MKVGEAGIELIRVLFVLFHLFAEQAASAPQIASRQGMSQLVQDSKGEPFYFVISVW